MSAAAVTLYFGAEGTGMLLILSQVILSLQLPFAVIPLVIFTSDPKRMGPFVNPRWLSVTSWVVAVVIAALNGWLLLQTVLQGV